MIFYLPNLPNQAYFQNMKTLFCILIFTVATFGQLDDKISATIKTLPKSKQFLYTFDKFTNVTRLSFNQRLKADRPLELQLTYATQTKDGKTSYTYWLRFYTYGSEWEFLKYDSLSYLIDGKADSLPKGTRSSEISSGRFLTLYESLYWEVQLELIESISKGKDVALRVGRLETTLDAGTKEGMGNVLLIAKAMRGE